MMNDIIKIKEFLASLPIDTADEIALLDTSCASAASDARTVLIVGDASAAPFLLLPTETQIFSEFDILPFPIHAVWAETFSVSVINENGETERYQKTEDFRLYCEKRFANLRQCTFHIADKRLRGLHLVYHTLTADMTALQNASAGCDGIVAAFLADAPGLTDDTTALLHWIKDVRCISGNTALLLRKRGFCNPMLSRMAAMTLGCKPQTFRCDPDGVDEHAPDNALFSAVEAAGGSERTVGDADTQQEISGDMLAGIGTRIRAQLEQSIPQMQTKASDADEKYKKYQSAIKTLRSLGDTVKYNLGSLIDDEIKSVYDEIDAFFDVLYRAFPDMVNEVLKNSSTAKADLKNLAGDYINDQIDAFVAALVDDIAQKCLVPRAEEHLKKLIEKFRLMFAGLKLEDSEAEEIAKTRFLQIAGMNLGNYQPYLMQLLSDFLHRRLLLLRVIEILGIDAAGKLADAIDGLIDGFVNLITLKEPFAKAIQNKVLNQMNDTKVQVKLQIRDTVIPRMSALLMTVFDDLTNIYEQQLTAHADRAEHDRDEARNAEDTMTAALQKLPSLFFAG